MQKFEKSKTIFTKTHIIAMETDRYIRQRWFDRNRDRQPDSYRKIPTESEGWIQWSFYYHNF